MRNLIVKEPKLFNFGYGSPFFLILAQVPLFSLFWLPCCHFNMYSTITVPSVYVSMVVEMTWYSYWQPPIWLQYSQYLKKDNFDSTESGSATLLLTFWYLCCYLEAECASVHVQQHVEVIRYCQSVIPPTEIQSDIDQVTRHLRKFTFVFAKIWHLPVCKNPNFTTFLPENKWWLSGSALWNTGTGNS